MRISDWSSDVCSSDLLTRRPQFLAVADARRKAVLPGLILQIRAHDERQQPREDEPAVRVGFTASRKIGNAVARNRARRRLRAVAAEVMTQHAAPGNDYLLIRRAGPGTGSSEERRGGKEGVSDG